MSRAAVRPLLAAVAGVAIAAVPAALPLGDSPWLLLVPALAPALAALLLAAPGLALRDYARNTAAAVTTFAVTAALIAAAPTGDAPHWLRFGLVFVIALAGAYPAAFIAGLVLALVPRRRPPPRVVR